MIRISQGKRGIGDNMKTEKVLLLYKDGAIISKVHIKNKATADEITKQMQNIDTEYDFIVPSLIYKSL